MITADQFKQAAWQENFDIVRQYVSEGGDVNALGDNGVSALVTFNIEILDYLFDNGADPSLIWADGSPAIGFHAWEVSVDSLAWFINKGVDPNIAHQSTGETCLHSLCSKPTDLETRRLAIKLLIDNGAQPNLTAATGVETGSFMRDVKVVGETALHRAAAYQSKETIELLINAGADNSMIDARGESPLSWASRHWRTRDILKLLAYGSYKNTL